MIESCVRFNSGVLRMFVAFWTLIWWVTDVEMCVLARDV